MIERLVERFRRAGKQVLDPRNWRNLQPIYQIEIVGACTSLKLSVAELRVLFDDAEDKPENSALAALVGAHSPQSGEEIQIKEIKHEEEEKKIENPKAERTRLNSPMKI